MPKWPAVRTCHVADIIHFCLCEAVCILLGTAGWIFLQRHFPYGLKTIFIFRSVRVCLSLEIIDEGNIDVTTFIIQILLLSKEVKKKITVVIVVQNQSLIIFFTKSVSNTCMICLQQGCFHYVHFLKPYLSCVYCCNLICICLSLLYLLYLMCICCILCVFFVSYVYCVSYVYLLYLCVFVVLLCVFVVLCVYWYSYFICRTVG